MFVMNRVFFLEFEVGIPDITAEWMVGAVLLETENGNSWNKSKFGSGGVSSALETRGVSSSSSHSEGYLCHLSLRFYNFD